MMIKALFRKQFAEVFSQFSKKSGAKNTSPKRGLITVILIFAALYLSLGMSFFIFAQEIFANLTEETYPLFYMLIGLIATAIGLLGSVFNAYTTIYEAKDNEMLLSLPIPPRRIVMVRVATLLVMTLLYSGSVLLPSFIAFLVYGNPTLLGGINAALLFIPLILLVEAVTIGIAFIVAAAARRVKNKKAIVLVFSMALVLVFYLVYFRAQSFVTELTAIGSIPDAARYGLFFYYSMGRASQGSAIDMLIVAVTGVGAFLIAYYLLSRFFVKFTTAKKGVDSKGKKGVVKAASLRFSLFKREWKIFSSSPAYVMNAAFFGVLALFVVPIVAIVKGDALRGALEMLAETFPRTNGAALAAAVVTIIGGMSCITAPSVSIEGKRITLLRSLPIETTDIFGAKIALHLAVVLPGTLFASITLAAVLGADPLSWVTMILYPIAHAFFTAAFGLTMNIHFPVLDWTDEITAIKSGAAVLITVFGVMILTSVVGVLYFAFASFLSDGVYLAVLTVLFIIADIILVKWLGDRGKRKFERLG